MILFADWIEKFHETSILLDGFHCNQVLVLPRNGRIVDLLFTTKTSLYRLFGKMPIGVNAKIILFFFVVGIELGLHLLLEDL